MYDDERTPKRELILLAKHILQLFSHYDAVVNAKYLKIIEYL